MELQEQVCSLDLAKKLCVAGVPQDSLWYWVEWLDCGGYHFRPRNPELLISDDIWLKCFRLGGTQESEMYSAFTVAELGAMLPMNKCMIKYCDQNRHGYVQHGDSWVVTYANGSVMLEVLNETEANAYALMVKWLKKRGVL